MINNRNQSPIAGRSAPSIKVGYWFGEGDLEGVNEFRRDLCTSYPTVEVAVKGEQGGLGGGLYTLFVEVATAITLPHFVQLLLDGVAFDLIKLGVHTFVLRPLLEAQKKLRARNPRRDAGEIARLVVLFNDAIVTVDADSRVEQNISQSIGELLRLLASHYAHLFLSSGEAPASIYVPVIEDTSTNRVARFRAVLEVDEDMRISKTVFFEYWGVTYTSGSVRVYDVTRSLLLDEQYIARQEYWQLMEKRWQQDRGL